MCAGGWVGGRVGVCVWEREREREYRWRNERKLQAQTMRARRGGGGWAGEEERMQSAFESESSLSERASGSWAIPDIAEGTLHLQVYFLGSLVQLVVHTLAHAQQAAHSPWV
jgi:hypothetical protein